MTTRLLDTKNKNTNVLRQQIQQLPNYNTLQTIQKLPGTNAEIGITNLPYRVNELRTAINTPVNNNSLNFIQQSTSLNQPKKQSMQSSTLKQTTQQYTPIDNTNMINQAFEEQKQSLINQLKQRIAESKAQYQNTITNAPQQFQPLKNQSELQRVQGLETLKETIANRGDRGGVGRQELLISDIAGQNRLNSIELEQQSVINDAQNAINQLEQQGRYEEAQIIADNATERLRAIIGEKTRIDEAARADNQFNRQIGLQERQIGNQETQFNQQFGEQQRQFNIGQQNYQQQFEQAATQQDIDNTFRQGQADIQNRLAERQITNQEAQQLQDNLFRDKQLEEQKRQFDQQFEESIRQNNIQNEQWEKTFTYQQMQDKINNALANRRISLDAAQVALSQAKFKADQDPNSLDNQIRKAQLEITRGSTDNDIRTKAASIASASGVFDQNTFNTVYNSLKGINSTNYAGQTGYQYSNPSNPYGILTR